MPSHFITIAKIEDLPPGTCKSIETQNFGIALFNLNGHIYALDNTCPHAGGPLGEGTIEGEHVACPWHGWKFHIPTGVCQKNPTPSLNVACYEVRIMKDSIQISLPSEPQHF
jgi:nitrite reductase (NADH) small subunit/3-phenylpropionate/trans-cinnamate dioxygenase ferredoxin subunit